jgi:type I restriction enzyme S subunit
MTWTPRDANQADVRYLWHYFLSEPGMLHLRRASPGSAGRNRTLGIAAFENTNIPLPDLSEQQRIAARLDRLASLIGGLERTRLPLAHVKARTLAMAEISTFPTRPLSDLLRTARIPIDIKADQSYRPLGVRSFGKGLIRYPPTTGEELSKLRYFSVQPHRLVVSNIKAWEGAVAMTRDGDETRVASSRFLQWEVADPAAVDLQYLRLFFATPMGLSLLGRASPGSADRNRTHSIQRFLDIAIPLPPLGQQRRLVDLASQIETIEAQLEQRNAVSSALLPAARNEAFARLT